MGVTTSSGPGIALKAEAMGLALMLELPLLVIDVQRGGPSTGLPTKTEQADLLQVMFGRNGEAPLPVLAARSPGDCFDIVQDAWMIATQLMIPVVVLSDGYIANGAEPWRIPDVTKLTEFKVEHPQENNNPDGPFKPYLRNELLARPWAIPGTPGLMHRVGGIEKRMVLATSAMILRTIKRWCISVLRKWLMPLSYCHLKTSMVLIPETSWS